MIWMEVTKDEYELPVAIADTAEELSEMTGSTVAMITSTASKMKHGRIKNGRFVKVEEK